MKLQNSALLWLWLTIVILVTDRWTKILAQKHLIFHEPYHVCPFFNFTLSYNTGSAFSFLDSAGGWQIYLFGIIAAAVSITLFILLAKMPTKQRWLAISYTLILGGALGNLWDRFAYGHVVDFIQWYVGNWYWPTFNIADSAVCIGAALLIIDAVRKSKTN